MDEGRGVVESGAETEVEMTTHPKDSLYQSQWSNDKLVPRDNWVDKTTVSAGECSSDPW